MEGVFGVLTPDDVTPLPEPFPPILAKEPMYIGEPIARGRRRRRDDRAGCDREDQGRPRAAAVHGRSAAEPVSRRPERALDGNVGMVFPPPIPATPLQTFKWTAADFAKVNDGQLPMGKAVEEWSYGDVDAGFATVEARLSTRPS